MERTANSTLHIGDWQVYPARGEMVRNGEPVRLEERTMRLLLCLAEHAGEIVSNDELVNHVWAGVAVSHDSVYQAVASLRRILGDDPRNPSYIANVPRLGYRMVAKVTRDSKPPDPPDFGQLAQPEPSRLNRTQRIDLRGTAGWLIASAAILLAAIAAFLFWRGPFAHAHRAQAAPAPTTLAVLPILDLTPGMRDEEFADGVTEELIDKLSRVPGFQVPPPTSSFALKGKQPSASEAARALGVDYVLDGSVRMSGTWVRVDVRLVRASTGFIVWSETYDQPKSDILTIQDDIANKVTTALKTSIGRPPI